MKSIMEAHSSSYILSPYNLGGLLESVILVIPAIHEARLLPHVCFTESLANEPRRALNLAMTLSENPAIQHLLSP